jgi:acyl-CoA thioesterase FadM
MRFTVIAGRSYHERLWTSGPVQAYRAAGHSLYTVETHQRNLRKAREGERLTLTIQVLRTDAKRLHILHEMYRTAGG